MQTEPIYGLPYLEDTDPVEDLAAQTKAIAEGLAQVVYSGDFKGPQGDTGPTGDPGIPGVNAVPADEAVAAYLTTTGSAARGALISAVADEVDGAVDPAVETAVAAAVPTAVASANAPLTNRVTALEQTAPAWTKIPLAAGVTVDWACYTRVKIGGVWWEYLWLRGVTIPSGNSISTALPSGHQPPGDVAFVMHSSMDPATVGQAWINTAGVIRCASAMAGTTKWHGDGLVAYPIMPLPTT